MMNEGLCRHDAVHAIDGELAGYLFDALRGGTEAAAEKFTDLYYDRLRKLTAAAWRNQIARMTDKAYALRPGDPFPAYGYPGHRARRS
jgi:hypothetical protein